MHLENNKEERRWIIAQRWSHVYFLSFRCDPDALRSKLPPGLDIDTFEGSAWLSIVPFHMSRVRFRFTPVLPMSSLWELNLRAYVKYRERPGIYFFTLDTDSWLGQKIAKHCFHLPYRFRKMSGHIDEHRYHFEAPGSFQVEARLGPMVESTALDTWLVERYHLYTVSKRHLYRGDALHEPWQLQQVELLSCEDNFSKQFGFEPAADVHVRYAKAMDVRFRPFVKLV